MNLKKFLAFFCLVFLIPANSLIAQKTRQGSTPRQDTMSVEADKKVNTQSDAGDIRAEAAYTVSKAADTNDGVCDADCSLREAVAAANLNSGADTITFDAALTAAPVTISLTGGVLAISDHVTIDGPGAELLTIDANSLSRVFVIDTGYSVTINSMSMTGGNVPSEEGGAIFSDGHLTLNRVHIYGNNARSGGAVVNFGIDTEMNIYDSTIANNTAQNAGAISTLGPLIMRNSTISGNTASVFAGAIDFEENPEVSHMIVNSTITGNSAASEGGVRSYFVEVHFANTIIAGNNSTSGSKDYTGATPVSLGWNLIGEVTDAAWFNEIGDQKGSSGSPLDPMLSPLANNGGPTPTHAFDLSAGISPAIDKGTSSAMLLDQRGYQRTVDLGSIANATAGDGTDIGAYELQAPTAAPVTITGRVLSSTGQPLHKATVTLTAQDGSEVSTVTDRHGNFRFDGVDGGEGYVLSVSRKRYRFSSVFVNADSDVAGLDIYAK